MVQYLPLVSKLCYYITTAYLCRSAPRQWTAPRSKIKRWRQTVRKCNKLNNETTSKFKQLNSKHVEQVSIVALCFVFVWTNLVAIPLKNIRPTPKQYWLMRGYKKTSIISTVWNWSCSGLCPCACVCVHVCVLVGGRGGGCVLMQFCIVKQ